MKKVLTGVIVLVFLALTAFLVKYFYDQKKKSPVTFETLKPEIGTIIKKTVATGSIVPKKEVAIKPAVSGILSELFVEEGDRVKAGQKIAKVQLIPNMSSLSNAEASIRRAKINVKNNKREADRLKGLYDEKVISEQEYQQQKIAYELSLEDLEAAKENLRIIKEGTPNAGNTTTIVKATVSGMVLELPVKEGSQVIESNTFNEGTTVAAIADMSEMVFEGTVDESEVGKLKPGMDLLLNIGAIENETFEAKLEFIAPKGKEEEGAIKFDIKAALDLTEDQFIRAGYSANADIVLERRDSVLTVNEGALIVSGDSIFVEIEVSEQQFEKKQIKTGLSDGLKTEVLEGLSKEKVLKKQQ